MRCMASSIRWSPRTTPHCNFRSSQPSIRSPSPGLEDYRDDGVACRLVSITLMHVFLLISLIGSPAPVAPAKPAVEAYQAPSLQYAQKLYLDAMFGQSIVMLDKLLRGSLT